MAKQVRTNDGFNDPSSGGGVLSFEGRTGAVVAQVGDYSASEITNDSSVPGADVAAALDSLVANSGSNTYPGATPPAVPNPLDDELQTPGAGIPAGWTLWDGGGLIYPTPADEPTINNANFGLLNAPASVNDVGGIVKAVPAGDFSAYLRVSCANPNGSGGSLGLILCGDVVTNPTTEGAEVIALFPASGQEWLGGRQAWTNYQTAGGFNAPLGLAGQGVWIRCRYDSVANTYFAEFSEDGLAWNRIVGAGNTPGFTPAYIGIGGHNNTGVGIYSYSKHFRISSSINFDDPVPSADYA